MPETDDFWTRNELTLLSPLKFQNDWLEIPDPFQLNYDDIMTDYESSAQNLPNSTLNLLRVGKPERKKKRKKEIMHPVMKPFVSLLELELTVSQLKRNFDQHPAQHGSTAQ